MRVQQQQPNNTRTTSTYARGEQRLNGIFIYSAALHRGQAIDKKKPRVQGFGLSSQGSSAVVVGALSGGLDHIHACIAAVASCGSSGSLQKSHESTHTLKRKEWTHRIRGAQRLSRSSKKRVVCLAPAARNSRCAFSTAPLALVAASISFAPNARVRSRQSLRLS